ncbi:uncharacterized protein LOC127108343 [Lathyrus oleraceus]|uniref:uncharacterized protein LOC127108343 n=1 Tax=Pisum sativum TaxID=3888 RepID=UPI0021D0E245|nr:uncharacterized protein LOC127108343 [Pisum sativum]
MHSLFFHSANVTTLHSLNLTSSLLFPNNHKLCSKPRFQSSIKINTPIPKHVPNKKVIILWDLDNKPPRGPPYDAALSLKTLAERFGDVVSISAYTKRHSFFNLPQWNTNQNPSPNSIPCRVCGHECKSIFDLKIHFKRVHLYQRKKLREKLKSIKLSRSKVWFVRRIHTYNEAAGNVVAPRVGFGLGSELRRAGVFVKVVKVGEKGNAADLWLEREMMSGEVGWLVLVSDDREFAEMLRKVREVNLKTVVVGDYWDRDLGKNADLWLPWNVVENGKVEGMGLMGRTEGSDDELEGDQNLGYDEYVTEEELLDDERF